MQSKRKLANEQQLRVFTNDILSVFDSSTNSLKTSEPCLNWQTTALHSVRKEQKKKDFKAADLMFKMYPSKRKLAMNEQTGKYLPKHKC